MSWKMFSTLQVSCRMAKANGCARLFSSTPCKDGKSSKRITAVIMGPPGSGKGTISDRIVRDFQLKHLSTGDILRQHITQKTEFGLEVKALVDAGKLVPSTLITPLMKYEIEKAKSGGAGLLLDGFPRSLDQAESLDEVNPPDVAVQLNVPFETIIDRIKARWIHAPSGRVYNLDFNPPKVPGKDDVTGEDLVQREDDKPESVKQRLEIYQEVMNPILDFYRKKKVLQVFTGTESNVIYPQIKSFLESFLNNSYYKHRHEKN